MGLPTTVICVSLLALLGVTTGLCSRLRLICQQRYPTSHGPVCGSNGVTYSNNCILAIASCRHPSITKVGDGECGPSCPQNCRPYHIPVCGSDGVTYGNDCDLAIASCRDPSMTKVGNGECDAIEDPETVLSGIYNPANNGTKEFEDSIALPTDSTLLDNDILHEFLRHVTELLREAIHHANLDPITIADIDFDVGIIKVKIEPGNLTGLSSVVLDGHLVHSWKGEVEGVRLSGEVGELVGSSGGFAKTQFNKYEFGVKATIGGIKLLIDAKVDKVTCKLIVEHLHIKIGEIKVEVTGVPAIIRKIIEFVVSKFGYLLEKLLNSQISLLKSLINTALSAIPLPAALKKLLGCM